MHSLWQDLRYGLRALLKKPGFTVVATLTLALGIGANTAIFSIVNAVLLQPLQYPEPERIVQLWETDRKKGAVQNTVSPHCFNDWRTQSSSFEVMAAYRYLNFTLTGGDQPESLTGLGVSAGFWSVLGVGPAIGRDFVAEEDTPGNNRVAILGHDLWQRRFGGDASLVGKTLELNGESHTVVGVMPAGVQFPAGVDVWAPMGIDLNNVNRGSHFLFAFGRVRRGETLTAVQGEMDTIARRLEQDYPNNNRDVGVNVVPLHEQMVKEARTALLILLGAVGLVLLIACTNVANLLLVRAAGRQRETVVRAALGASRGRLMQQFVSEGVLLSLMGGVGGLVLAWQGVDLLKSLLPGNVPRVKEIGVDGWVLGFTLLISLVTGVLAALAPSLFAARPDLSRALRESGHQVAGGRLRSNLRGLLVVSQIALAVVLLVGAGLLITSFARLQRVNPGFDANNLLTATVSLPRARFAEAHQRINFFDQALQRIRLTGERVIVGAVTDLPMSGSRSRSSIVIEGVEQGDDFAADIRIVSPGYFLAMRIPLLKGRDFVEGDDLQAGPAIIVNRRFVERFWPNEEPLGKRIRIGTPEEVGLYKEPPWREVIGVVGDIRHMNLRDAPDPEMYLPYAQVAPSRMTLVVRGGGDAAGLTNGVRDAVLSVDPNQPLTNVRTMEERISRSVTPQRFSTWLLSLFALLALVLAGVGIYGVVSYSVEQGTREIGIRMALGAPREDVLKLVIGRGMLLALIGMGLGILGSLALTRLMQSLLFEVSPTDPATFAVVSLVLVAVTSLACYLPARRAANVDPMLALRYE